MSTAERMASASAAVDTSPLTPEGDTHHVQLDAIRAIAVVAVMINHYIPQTEQWIDVGTIGVRVFFALSGFLITGILLRARRDAESNGFSKTHVLRNFYLRRFLRIFPLFYAVLIVGEIIHLEPVRDSFLWHVAYLSNVYLYRRGSVFDSITPLWSLAVEEQFYLVWPWLILYLPKRWIVPVILIAIPIGPLFRAGQLFFGHSLWQASILTPACFDNLGLGALLAVLRHSKNGEAKSRVMRISLLLGMPLFIFSVIGFAVNNSDWWIVPMDLSVGLWGMVLIDRAYTGFKGSVGAILRFAPLTYLGIISYGIYIMHNFVGGFARRVLRVLHIPASNELVVALAMCLITISLASISWQFFEKPINQLKHRFPYRPRAIPVT